MISLPKLKRTLGNALTKKESVRKIVLSAALGVGLAVTANASAMPEPKESSIAVQSSALQSRGALILTPAAVPGTVLAQNHYSHVSHYSHSSHQSHYSHYSGR